MTQAATKKRKILKPIFILITIVMIFPFSTYLISYQAKSPAVLAYEEAEIFEQHYGFKHDESTIGIILYPGGLVHPKAYARFAQALADESQASVFVTEPWFHLAITQIRLAEKVIQKHPHITTWMIGGHSLGGTAAAFYTHDHLDKIKGLFFLASYTTAQADFTPTSLPVISMYGSEDMVLSQASYLAAKRYLPPNHHEVMIAGGNHSQFADYGPQRGDGLATITGLEQQTIVVSELTAWTQTLLIG